jgi:K+-sensing histidine kinase KdpD
MAGNKTEINIKNRKKILLVDDDTAFLKVAQAILQSKGYSVDVAYKAKEAMSLFQNYTYNVIILDMLLPDMTGIELLTSVNRIQPDIISIISTGYSSIENSVQSLNLGAFAYLEKPLNPDKLLEVIYRGLEKQQLLLENRRLLKELEQRNRDLNILLSVSQAITGSIDREHIIKSALDIIARSLGLDGSYILAICHNSVIIDNYFGLSNEIISQLKPVNLKGNILEMVCERNEPVILGRIKGVSDYFLTPLAQGGYHSLLAVPVASAKENIGVLVFTTLSEHEFTSLEVNLFKAIGREIAVAVKNTQLLEEASSVKALRELDSMRTELLANVSHELRTPLAAIKGFASSLLQPDINFDDETRLSFIQTIDSEADRLSHLIDDLLLMSRIEAGAFKARKEWYEMTEVVNSIKDRLYSVAVKHNLRMVIPDNLPSVLVDGPRIGQVISNLVENAVKYSPEASEITINIDRQNQNIITQVVDKGIGIPKEYQSMVFDRFNQLASKNGQRKGSGLGLSICRGIVESHEGKIWVESEPGHGSKFSFSLPVIEENSLA